MDDKQEALDERKIDARGFSPSAARNRDAIRKVFFEHMPSQGSVLELGSGTGEHAIHIAAAAPGIRWFPGDPDAQSRASIAGWIRQSGLDNVEAPHAVAVAAPNWIELVDPSCCAEIAAIVSINVMHITPFAVSEGLIRGAGELLTRGGRLFLYGPFSRNGKHTARSNARFDDTLRARDPLWGLRDLEREILPLAHAAAFCLSHCVDMPANNYSLIFERV